jgi:hypothetical protein
MSGGVRRIRSVGGGCHEGLNCMKKDLLESDGKTREEILRVKEQRPNEILATTLHLDVSRHGAANGNSG